MLQLRSVRSRKRDYRAKLKPIRIRSDEYCRGGDEGACDRDGHVSSLFDGCSDVDNDEAAADDDADVEDDDDVDDQDDRCCCTESDRSPELGPRYT